MGEVRLRVRDGELEGLQIHLKIMGSTGIILQTTTRRHRSKDVLLGYLKSLGAGKVDSEKS